MLCGIKQAMAIIECVPNVSEGRRTGVVTSMTDVVAATHGVRLLDWSSDPAHNRSVLTMAGDAAGLKAAVLALFARATEQIDLRTHSGEHPRLGAVDVVPFIPIEGVTMADCVALAKDVAAEIASRFDIPVFLYEEAATHPARRNLEDIRPGRIRRTRGEAASARVATRVWTVAAASDGRRDRRRGAHAAHRL